MKTQNKEEETCSNTEHIGYYRYSCNECCKKNSDCNTRKKAYPDGSWCHCKCQHNTYFCCKCLKPVKIIGGIYYYVK